MEINVIIQLNKGLVVAHTITGKTGSVCQRDSTNLGTCTPVVWLREKGRNEGVPKDIKRSMVSLSEFQRSCQMLERCCMALMPSQRQPFALIRNQVSHVLVAGGSGASRWEETSGEKHPWSI